jgi:hypothetical protein
MRFKLFLPGLTCLLAASPGLSQPARTPAPQRDPRAIAVLQQAVVAMGGGGVLLNDTVVQATVRNPSTGTPARAATIKTLGADVRMDVGVDALLVRNGRRLGFKDGRWHGAGPPGRNHQRIEHLPVLLLLSEIALADASVTYVGEEKIGEQSAHRIRFARVSRLGTDFDEKVTRDSELEAFIDSASGLVLRVSYLMYSAHDWRIGIPVEIAYSDYKNLGGVMVPCRQQKRVNGNLVSETLITDFAANTGMPVSLFEVR